MKIHLYVLLFTVVFIHHSKCDESVTTPPVPGSSQSPSVEVPSATIQHDIFREELHQIKASILNNSKISAQDLTELSKLINKTNSVEIIQWKLDEFNLKVKFSDDEIKKHASLFLYALREIIKEKVPPVVTTTPTNGPTPSTNSETSKQQSTTSKSPKTAQNISKPDASSGTQVSEVLCVSVEQCKSRASQALWYEALKKCNDANPGKVVGEDDLIQYFESVMKAFNNVMKVGDFESSLKVVIADPPIVTDTPPTDTADNEQTQKNDNGQKTENGSDQKPENDSEDFRSSDKQVTVETSGNVFSGFGAWHFITIFIVISAAVVIGYVCMHNRKKLREGVGMYLADANRNRKRARDYRPLKMKA